MKINQLKAGVILSYASMLCSNLISIIYTPIMLRLLGQSEYGLYTLASSTVGYLGILSFGFSGAYIRYYARYKIKEEYNGIAMLNGMYFLIYLLFALLTIICGWALVMNTNVIFSSKLSLSEINTTKILMAILVANLAITFVTDVFRSYVIANEKYIFQKVLLMIKSIIGPFITLPILFLGYKSVGLVMSTTIISIIIEIINIIFCIKKLHIKFSFRNFDFTVLKGIAVFSFFIFLNMISDQVNWSVDKFLLGALQGSVAVAIYGLGSQFNTYYMILSTSVSSVLIPKVNYIVAQSDDNNLLTELMIKVGRIQFYILSMILTGFIFFGKQFIQFWGGSGYSDAYWIVLILLFPVTIPLIQNLVIEIQRAKNMHKFRSIVYIAIAALNILLSIPLCKIFSGIGCAIGTAFSILIGNGLIMNLYYHKKMKLNMFYFWKQILKIIPALFIPILVGLSIMLFVDITNIFVFLAMGIVYVAIYCACMWLFAMNEYEKEIIKKPIMKILRKLTV